MKKSSSQQPLADGVAIALNGWNPTVNSSQGMSFDARPGSVAVVDGIHFRAARDAISAIGELPPPVVSFDFERPTYSSEADLVGVAGWTLSPFSVAPASSVVSRTALDAQLKEARLVVEQAHRELAVIELPSRAAKAQLIAAQAQSASLEARIAAELAKYGDTSASNLKPLAQAASLREREAALRVAEADVLSAQLAVATAEQKPAEDSSRAKELETARTALASATAAVSTAANVLADPARLEIYSPLSPVYPATSTGRRRAFAQWLTSRQHPLTARVAVNHIWSRHFHVPLVATVYDFGRNGAAPTHPELA
ncbi:MAG: hypothetical protein B7Z55_16130 [Planctomycetales bacterium 12-60-4]|nr:MAG: hypothetical protein B7Z55_16130 [Planctomycetales bacterium 12-60-4]